MGASAQPVSFGVVGGIPATPFFTAIGNGPFYEYTFPTNPYIVGLSAEVRVTRHVSVGVEGLFRHWRYNNLGKYQPNISFFNSHTSANDWEFPLLARYRIHAGRMSCFVTAGGAIDWLQHMRQVTEVTYISPVFGPNYAFSTTRPLELSRRTTFGIVAGAGVSVRVSRVHVEPEVRYTFWTRRHFGEPSPDYFGLFTQRDQVEVLVGFRF